MKKYFVFLMAGLFLIAACSSPKTEKNEAGEKATGVEKPVNMDSIQTILIKAFRADQYYRYLLDSLEQIHGWDSPELQNTYAVMHKVDSINLKVVDQIIRNYGWPGKSMVGEQASTGAFLVLQHSGDVNQMEKYQPLLKEAAESGELDKSLYAIFVDRILMYKNEQQIYGSQIVFNKTKKVLELYPIEDEANVDERRASVGLEPLKEYLNMMGVPFDADTVSF